MLETKTRGLIPTLRSRLFGAPDPTERQLRRIARRTSRGAKVANVTAAALVIFVSILSLAGLSSGSLTRLTNDWTRAHVVSVTDLINVVVNLLLVIALDTAMLHAAAHIRKLRARRVRLSEISIHALIIAIVALAEAGTYTYASWELDHPGNWLAWCLIIARGSLIPVAAIYLSLARELPVAPRDILAEAELVSGGGMIRSVVAAANNASVSLADQLALYRAVASMDSDERNRFDRMIDALPQPSLVEWEDAAASRELLAPATTRVSGREVVTEADQSPECEASEVRDDSEFCPSIATAVKGQAIRSRSNVRTLQALSSASRRADSARADSGRSRYDTMELRQRREVVVAEILATTPKVGVRQLAQLIAQQTGVPCQPSVAQELLKTARAVEA